MTRPWYDYEYLPYFMYDECGVQIRCGVCYYGSHEEKHTWCYAKRSLAESLFGWLNF